MTMYRWNFCESVEKAKALAKEQGYGAVYTNVKYSKTKKDYNLTCLMAGHGGDDEWKAKYPAVVCWNEHV